MHEHEPDNPEPMDPVLQEYVDAFVAVERPASSATVATWSAIENEVGADAPRSPWLAVGLTVGLAAAALIAIFGVRAVVFDQDSRQPGVQAPHEGAAATEGESAQLGVNRDRARSKGAAPRSSADETPADDTPEAAPPLEEIEPHDSAADGAQGLPAARPRPGDAAAPSSRGSKAASRKGRASPPAATDDGADSQTHAPADDLEAELGAFKAAKRALDGNEPREALRQLAALAKQFPRGALRREAQLLQTQALCAAGRKTEARALRDRFLAKHPTSPLAGRMREICVP